MNGVDFAIGASWAATWKKRYHTECALADRLAEALRNYFWGPEVTPNPIATALAAYNAARSEETNANN